MASEKLLSVQDITRQLDIGKATTKFLLKRFKSHLPGTMVAGQPLYPPRVIHTLCTIQGKLEMGILPDMIEQQLTDDMNNISQHTDKSKELSLSMDGLSILKDVFSDINEQQRRIAQAHEKRAEAEERKAVAIEKRALAEEKKADAMNNIARALQEMNQLRAVDPVARQIASGTAAILSDEMSEPEDVVDTVSETPGPGTVDEPDEMPEVLAEKPEPVESSSEDPAETAALLDDLSALISDKMNDPVSDQALDDLASLLTDTPAAIEPGQDISDADIADAETDPELDDLSLLVEDRPQADREVVTQQAEMDDLSALISEPAELSGEDKTPGDPVNPPLDDLALLITPENTEEPAVEEISSEMDDLSALLEAEPPESEAAQTRKDDQIADAGPEEPAPVDGEEASQTDDEQIHPVSISISPEDDRDAYKGEVMKAILELKNKGLSVAQTTRQFNANKIKTLSGKPEWGEKAIAQIYSFIDAAK